MNANFVDDRSALWTRTDIVSTVCLYLTAIMSWNDDTAYAMTLVKHLTVPIGAWPLQEYNKFALLRHTLSSFGLVRFQFLCHKRTATKYFLSVSSIHAAQ